MKRWILSFFLLCHLSLTHATLTLQVDKHIVGLHDTVTLTLSSDQAQSNAEPDIRPLAPFFKTLSTSHQISYQLINGVTEVANQWIFILLPKKTGQIQVPPLTMGTEKTETGIEITVTPRANDTTDSSQQDTRNDDVFIRTQVTPTSGYITQQLLYTVSVYTRRHLINVDYTPPHAKHALMIQMDQGRRYQTELRGEPYSVEELQYAFFPNQSGTLTISAPRIKAMIYEMLPQPIDVSGQTTRIPIHPAPTTQTPFLPTESLTLSETFDPARMEVKQGDTFIRTITLTAQGLPAAFLPVPKVTGKGFSAYPSAPVLKTMQTQQGLISTVSITIPYLFNEPGQQTLPAIHIQWYHPKTHQFNTASLPAHSIQVIGSMPPQVSPNEPPKAHAPPPSTPSPWIFSTVALLALLLILLMTFFFYRNQQPKTTTSTPPELKKIRKHLRQACLQNDPKMTYHWLLEWARTTWPTYTITHLHHIADCIDHPELKEELEKLNQQLYSPNAAKQWHGAALWKIIERSNKTIRVSASKPILPQLNH
ncbi:MAG: BatD family protein [Gammaproteobacteria bacterium]|nr:BatD family protein [Gammaproteobacteria bacterium]